MNPHGRARPFVTPLRGFTGNVGVQYTNALTTGPEGFETAFTVNVLANHLFVRLL